jgi:predicted RNA-binding protein
MCEASAYILKDGREELVLENVESLEDNNGEIQMVSIFGEQKRIQGKIKTFNLLDHKIVLEEVVQ